MHPLQTVFAALISCIFVYVVIEAAALWARYVLERRGNMSTENETEPEKITVVSTPQPAQPEPSNVIAKPNNGHKTGVVRCAHVAALAAQTSDDPAVVEAVIIALARIIIRAKRADGSAKVGETDAIRHGLGVQPGGSNPLYALARAALRAELDRQRGTPKRDEIAEIDPAGRVVRETTDGTRYKIVEGQEVPA